MEVFIIHAEWCGHCRKLMEKDNIKKFIKYLNDEKIKYNIWENDKNRKEINLFQKNNGFYVQYFPTLLLKKDGKLIELSPNFSEFKKKIDENLNKENFNNEERYGSESSKKYNTETNKKNKILFVCATFKNQRENKLIKKYKDFAEINGFNYKARVDENISNPFFILIDGENSYKYYFIIEDLKNLYTYISNSKKNLGTSFIPQFIYNFLNPDYETQSQLGNNKVIKCKYSHDENGNSHSYCQTIY